MSRAVGAVILFLCAAGVAVLLYVRRPDGEPAAASHADPRTCFECHEDQTRAWRDSHHDLAMQEATAETVLGDFDDARFEHKGVVTRFFRRDGRFFVETEGPDGRPAEFEAKYTFGITPLQQYLLELPGGRLQALTVAWDTKEQRWFTLHDDVEGPDDVLHWTGPAYNWNHMCAECHSTGVRKNFDATAGTFATTWFEIDVGCQGCHGPGSRHVEWARRIEETREEYGVDDLKGFDVRLVGRAEVEHCARCHSRRSVVSEDYRHGGRYGDHHDLALLEPGLYHADGQILDEVFVYGSFRQSRMYAQGVRCTHCHDPHTARLRLEGNLMCQRCHKEEPPPEFTTLKSKEYDNKEHHFHEPGTPGSFCIDCHAPPTKYMVVDPRYDHSFRIPRPDLTLAYGVPNACTGCHADKTVEWSAEAVDRWYPRTEPRPVHWVEALAPARAGGPDALPPLRRLAGDTEQPGIARATALRHLAAYGDVDTVAQSLGDEDPLVRAAAAGGLSGERVPAARKLELLAPLLEDPVRHVRVEAARVLTEVPPASLTGETRAAFDRALDEFKARQMTMLDRPDAYLNLGVMHLNLGDRRQAEASYREALEVEPRFWPARANLANLLNAAGRNTEAEEVLRGAVARDRTNGEAWYSLGLLLAEERRVPEAADALGEAARLLDRGRVHYNYGLALQQLARPAEAEEALLRAARLSPGDPAIRQALVILYMQCEQPDLALPHARRLVELVPDAPGPKELVRRIEAELER